MQNVLNTVNNRTQSPPTAAPQARATRYPDPMATVLWIIIGVLTLCTGLGALVAIVAMAGSKYRG